MAPLPKRRLSRQRQRKREDGHLFKRLGLNFTVCPNCKKNTEAYKACRFCGYYKGRKILNIAS